jgi:predicted enzyme related to lactoylglutathione lyase
VPLSSEWAQSVQQESVWYGAERADRERDDNARRLVDMATAAPLRGLSTVDLFAADHAAAREWYTQFLGVEPYFERPGYVEFRIGDYQAELGIIDSKYVPGTQSHEGRAGVVVYWHVDDVDAVLAKAVGMGARQLEATEDRGQGFITATAVDPFGNLLGLMYNPHYLEILSLLKPT